MATAFKKRPGDYVRVLSCSMKSWAEDVDQITDAFKGRYSENDPFPVLVKCVLFLRRFVFPILGLCLLINLFGFALHWSVRGVGKVMSFDGGVL